MSTERRTWGEDGFALLETMVAGSILVLGLLSVWGSIVYGARSNQLVKQKKDAYLAAYEKLADLQVHPFAKILEDHSTGGSPGPTFQIPGLGQGAPGEGRVSFIVDENDAALIAWGGAIDLNGDGDIEDEDVVVGYEVLPVEITITYQGLTGQETARVRALLKEDGR